MAGFDWDHLRTFIAVARSGRLTVAAAGMGSDHTTLSRRITCLEQALRAKLFERSPSGYDLTAQGVQLLALAEQMESLSSLAMDTVGGSAEAIEGVVRIAGPEGFGSYFLAPRLVGLGDRHPGLNVQVLVGPSTFSLAKREADILIKLSRPSDGRVVARRLIDYDLRLYASRDYLAKRPVISEPGDLKHHDLVGYIGDLIQMPELDYLADLSCDAATRLQSSSLLVQLKATIAGGGICVLPAFIARCEPELEAVLPEEVKLSRSFWMIVHEDQKERARVKVASEFIVEQVREAASQFKFRPDDETRDHARADGLPCLSDISLKQQQHARARR